MNKWIQSMLNKDGFNLAVDGNLGNASIKVVKEFQERYGLVIDGNVGTKTYAKLTEVNNRKYYRKYYDKQTTYFAYPKLQVEKIDIINSIGSTKWSVENVLSMFNRSDSTTVSNGGMYDMGTGATCHYFVDNGVQIGYNAYDPFALLVMNDGTIKFADVSKKVIGVKDGIGFSPSLIINGVVESTNKNLSKAYIVGYEPRHAFMETKNYYVEVFVNGRQPLKGWLGCSINMLIDRCKKIGLSLDAENGGCLNAGNLDGGGSCSIALEGKEVLKNTNYMRRVDNGLGIKMK